MLAHLELIVQETKLFVLTAPLAIIVHPHRQIYITFVRLALIALVLNLLALHVRQVMLVHLEQLQLFILVLLDHILFHKVLIVPSAKQDTFVPIQMLQSKFLALMELTPSQAPFNVLSVQGDISVHQPEV